MLFLAYRIFTTFLFLIARQPLQAPFSQNHFNQGNGSCVSFCLLELIKLLRLLRIAQLDLALAKFLKKLS